MQSPLNENLEGTSTSKQWSHPDVRAILLGLEFLVAADIISTVAVRPVLQDVIVLAGVVLIRTFLSFSLEVEISGRWPWRRAET